MPTFFPALSGLGAGCGRYKKGPYYAGEGDFSAAGAAGFSYVTSLPRGIVQATPGSYGYGRLLVADSNGLSLTLEVFNLLDESVSDIDYFYESRLSGESEAVEDVHLHPAEKRAS